MHDAKRFGDRNGLGPIPARVSATRRPGTQSGPRQIDGFNEPFRYGEADDQPLIDRAVLDAHYALDEVAILRKG